MRIGEARAVAHDWVTRYAVELPGFEGAWIAGSTNALPESEVLPAASDLDVMVLLAADDPPVKPGKFLYEGALLEVTFLNPDAVRTPERVLGHYHLASSVHSALILSDPSGSLGELQAAVNRDFAARTWIERRCEMASTTVINRIEAVEEGLPFEEQVMSWLFATGGVPHILLVAGLRNPTVRTRYVAVRELLGECGDLALYQELLVLLDPEGLAPERVGEHLEVLEGAFDAAARVVRTPFPFAADLSDAGRPVAIGGSRELMARGDHREAIFWLVATFARCQMVLHADATGDGAHRWDNAFRDLLADLGISSFDDLRRRGEDIRAVLAKVGNVAARIRDGAPGTSRS